MASRESIQKKLNRTRERIEELNVRERELMEQYQDAELSESLRLLKKYKITSDNLERRLLLSDEEVERLLEERLKGQHREQDKQNKDYGIRLAEQNKEHEKRLAEQDKEQEMNRANQQNRTI